MLIVVAILLFFVFVNPRNPAYDVSPTTMQQNASSGVATNTTTTSYPVAAVDQNSTAAVSQRGILTEPLAAAQERITKKPFGIYITPATSPVQPEKFTGYHTGVDFETTAAEQTTDVTIHAICSGPLAMKKYATGYGGVAVQSCMIANQKVTVVYGHLRLSSITASVGAELQAGNTIGVLGKGYSVETDGERKHLHLGIHKGTSINIKGYVQTRAELDQWLDAAKYL